MPISSNYYFPYVFSLLYLFTLPTSLQSMTQEEEIKSYFLSCDKSYRWFEKETQVHDGITATPLNSWQAHGTISSLYGSRTELSKKQRAILKLFGNYTCAIQSKEMVIAGFSDGSVFLGTITSKEDACDYKGERIRFDYIDQGEYPKRVTACALVDENGVYSYPDKPALLVGYENGLLLLCDRKNNIFTGFKNVVDNAITHIIPGNIPNMWIIGGDKYVSLMRFFYDEKGWFRRRFRAEYLPPHCRASPRQDHG